MPSSSTEQRDGAGRLVCREGQLYRLAAGSAGLFVDAAGHAGAMHLMARLEGDMAVFGLPAGAGPLRLVLVAGADSRVEILPAGTDSVPAAELARWAESWFRTAHQAAQALDEPAREGPPPAAEPLALPHRLEAGDHAVAAGERVVPAGEGVLWCDAQPGVLRSLWAGESADLPFPVSRETPLEVAEAGRVRLRSTQELAADGQLWTALAAFNALFAARLTHWLGRRADAFAQRIAAAADADAAVLSAAMQQLGGQSAGPAVLAGSGEPALVAMLRIAADAAGAELPHEPMTLLGAGSLDEFVKVLASGAGLRARLVRLKHDWWRHPGEAMLGFLNDGTPVALVPQGRAWVLYRPGDRLPEAVGPRTVEALADQAYVLYRGFGETVTRPGRALIAFVAGMARRELVLIGLASLAAGLLGLATPFLAGFLVQSVIPDGVRSEVVQLVMAILAVSCGVIGFELVRGLTVLRVESRLGSAIEGALWDRMLRLPVGFFRQFGAGDLALRADAVNEMRRAVGFATITALISALFSVFNLVVLFCYGLAPALLALAVCAVEVVLLTGHALFNMGVQRQALENAGAMQTLTVQIFQGIAKLRVAAAESRLLARWTRLFAVDQRLHYRLNVVGSAVTAFGAGWNILVMAALIGLVGFGFSSMTLGDYVTYSGVFGQFVAATLSLAGIIPAIASVAPLWNRARPILTEPTEEAGRRLHPGILRGEIEAIRVSFSYPGGEPALHDVSLRVPAGAFVALVGPSGSGKSTLMRLLLGFEQPDGGHVLLDRRNLRDLDAGAVRRQLGVVLQHSRVEAGSIYQNIAGAAPLTAEEAWAAAERAGLAPDIAAMPMGLHTHVDDTGSTLSGGQRQRLLLARAIARRPRIMLLDEATSALDNVVQAHVMDALAQMNVTRLVVAHRLSTVRDADLIVVMSAGRIVETGAYEDLAAAGGLFSELIRRQMA